MLNFYQKYLAGNVFVNSATNSFADLAGNLITFVSVIYLSNKKGLLTAFLCTVIGGVVVACTEIFSHPNPKVITIANFFVPFGVLVAKFGSSMSYNYFYFTMVDFFK